VPGSSAPSLAPLSFSLSGESSPSGACRSYRHSRISIRRRHVILAYRSRMARSRRRVRNNRGVGASCS
jgi:hypothetical protein